MDLLDPKSNYNQLWTDYIEEFGDEDDAVIVVEGAGREQVVPVLEELSALLAREDRLFHAVLHEVDLGKIRSKGLHYLSPEELGGIDHFLDRAGADPRGRLVAAQRQPHGRRAAAADASGRTDNPARMAAARDKVTRLADSLGAALGQRGRYQSPWPEMPSSFAILSELNSEYLLTKQGQLGFVLLRLARGDDRFNHCTEATEALRELIAQSQARHPDVKIGLTGLPIMENDEMRSSQTSMFWASLVSMVAVGLLFVAGFGGARHALLANAILLVGMALAFGYATLAVGHLNILSVTFTVTLIGIGIDYGIYYVARYLQLRSENQDCETALLESARIAGPAITTGAITTAIAFFAAGLTSFKGVAELGIIAGGGILLCAIAELVLLPACIWLVDRSGWGVRMPKPLGVHRWIAPLIAAAASRWPSAWPPRRFWPWVWATCGTTTTCSTCRPRGWKASSSNASCSPSAIKASGTPCRLPTAAKSCSPARKSSCSFPRSSGPKRSSRCCRSTTKSSSRSSPASASDWPRCPNGRR